MYKGTESLFFRLKILFYWEIIVVEVTETLLQKERAIMALDNFGGGHLSIFFGIHAMAHSGWNTANAFMASTWKQNWAAY